LQNNEGLAFFGNVTASLSHEISNVLATIRELSGLLGDFLSAAEAGRPIDITRLKDISGKITENTKRGEVLIKRLNRFSHSIDDPVKTFELKTLLEEISTISERYAFLKKVRLETDFTEEAITVSSNPFGLQQAVFFCIDIALAFAKESEVIKLSLERDGDGARIAVSGIASHDAEEAGAKLSLLSFLTEELGARAEIVLSKDQRYSLALFIPRVMPGGDAG